VVDHDVHAEDLEAHVVFVVLGLAALVVVGQDGLCGYQSADEYFLDLGIKELRSNYLEVDGVDVPALVSELFEDGGERAFVPHVGFLGVGVEDEVGVLLVDGVVGQVLADVVEVGEAGRLVLLGGEAHHSYY